MMRQPTSIKIAATVFALFAALTVMLAIVAMLLAVLGWWVYVF